MDSFDPQQLLWASREGRSSPKPARKERFAGSGLEWEGGTAYPMMVSGLNSNPFAFAQRLIFREQPPVLLLTSRATPLAADARRTFASCQFSAQRSRRPRELTTAES